jgi:hypothetical protein
MTDNDPNCRTVITFSETLALAGIKEQWDAGDPLALVEAITICSREDEPYPDWVCRILNAAMTDVYEAVYSTDDSANPTSRIMRSEDQIKWRFDRARDRLVNSLGLSADRDNAGKIRKRLIRDAYLAELIAQRCEFISAPTPKFKGVNSALTDIAEILEEGGEQVENLQQLPPECWNTSMDTIKRAWKKHRDDLSAVYLKNPYGPAAPLDWFLGYTPPKLEED